MEPTQEDVDRVAKAISLQLDILLADYTGDAIFVENDDDDATPEQMLFAQATITILGWLRDRWDYKAETPNGDMRDIASNAIAAMFKIEQ